MLWCCCLLGTLFIVLLWSGHHKRTIFQFFPRYFDQFYQQIHDIYHECVARRTNGTWLPTHERQKRPVVHTRLDVSQPVTRLYTASEGRPKNINNTFPCQFVKVTVRGLFITAAIGSGAGEGERFPMVETSILSGLAHILTSNHVFL
jgi:hypothetical protein